MPDGRLYLYGSWDHPYSDDYCGRVAHCFSTDDMVHFVDHGIIFRNDEEFLSVLITPAVHDDCCSIVIAQVNVAVVAVDCVLDVVKLLGRSVQLIRSSDFANTHVNGTPTMGLLPLTSIAITYPSGPLQTDVL